VASAAGAAGADIIFLTSFWGATTVCARTNDGCGGTVTVDPFPYGDSSYNTIYAPAYSERCTSSWWFGNPVHVTNRGCGTMAVRGY
jgi:hypothetical protein